MESLTRTPLPTPSESNQEPVHSRERSRRIILVEAGIGAALATIGPVPITTEKQDAALPSSIPSFDPNERSTRRAFLKSAISSAVLKATKITK